MDNPRNENPPAIRQGLPSRSASSTHTSPVHIVGGGLAGSEAAYFLAQSGFSVILHEMRPKTLTEAHQTDQFAELVCSNSFKSKAPHSAPGMLKAEMTAMGSLVLSCASSTSVPGGEALTVDRDLFSKEVTERLRSHPHIQVVNEEVHEPFSDSITLFSTGPLTSDSLSKWIARATGADDLYFYDAIAPIIDASSIDMDHAFLANRYGKGEEEAYLNCPLNESEYHEFIEALTLAEKVPPKAFEKEKFFQGCQPIEAIAATGKDTLRFGPMKPVGLTDPRNGSRPHAVVQLRPENKSKTAYNLVGFQTKLKYGEQKKVFGKIPALQRAEYLRLGSIHRNTYLCSPQALRADLSLKKFPNVYFAGQITGVEGYLESAASGMLAGLFIKQRLQQKPHSPPPINTAFGALLNHVTQGNSKKYDPSNIHFGLFDPTFFEGMQGAKKEELRQLMADQAIVYFSNWWKQVAA